MSLDRATIINLLAQDMEEAAAAWRPTMGVGVEVDREQRKVVLMIVSSARETLVIEAGEPVTARAFHDLESLDELIADLQAARASLTKLSGGTP